VKSSTSPSAWYGGCILVLPEHNEPCVCRMLCIISLIVCQWNSAPLVFMKWKLEQQLRVEPKYRPTTVLKCAHKLYQQYGAVTIIWQVINTLTSAIYAIYTMHANIWQIQYVLIWSQSQLVSDINRDLLSTQVSSQFFRTTHYCIIVDLWCDYVSLEKLLNWTASIQKTVNNSSVKLQ